METWPLKCEWVTMCAHLCVCVCVSPNNSLGVASWSYFTNWNLRCRGSGTQVNVMGYLGKQLEFKKRPLGEWHWNMYNIIYEMSCQSRFDARYWMLGAGALERPRGMVWGGRREKGSGWGTRVCPWRIHFDIWQNQYNIVKFKNKIKLKKKRGLFILKVWFFPRPHDCRRAFQQTLVENVSAVGVEWAVGVNISRAWPLSWVSCQSEPRHTDGWE